jgi:hypothetical protein
MLGKLAAHHVIKKHRDKKTDKKIDEQVNKKVDEKIAEMKTAEKD